MPAAIVWLRNDLRLADNPALSAACRDYDHVVALYIHQTDGALRPIGAAARWWLHESLQQLGEALADIGVALVVRSGQAESALRQIVADLHAEAVFWNRRYGPGERALDTEIKHRLRADGLAVSSHPGNVLVEPWQIQTGQDKPYSVFTPFWKSLRDKQIATPLTAPVGTAIAKTPVDVDYAPPHWARKLVPHWAIGARAAQERLESFLDDCVEDYPAARDFPARPATSLLSPHLRFGEISARQVWHAARTYAHAHPAKAGAVDKFLSELAWRDFSYHQLYHRENIASLPMQGKFADLQWRQAPEQFEAWRKGQTGIPIVDAGMRELWATGYMHNRVRMLVASFLTKNLLIDWRAGEAWFWNCLVDADEANNPASWQWVAGCGLDAAPYFRIFNPVSQGERFDENGAYVRQWVPELAALPDKHIHAPSDAPAPVLKAAGIRLGETYPQAVADLKATRQRALDTYGAVGTSV